MTCAASPSRVTAPRPQLRTGRAKMPCSSRVAGSMPRTRSTTRAGNSPNPAKNLASAGNSETYIRMRS